MSSKQIRIKKRTKFSPHFLNLKELVSQSQIFEKPKKRDFLIGFFQRFISLRWLKRRKKERRIKINFITPGEKRLKKEREEGITERFIRNYESFSLVPFESRPFEFFSSKWKPLFCFIFVCFIFIFFLQTLFSFQVLKNKKDIILATSLKAYQDLSLKNFDKAQESFKMAQKELTRNSLLVFFIPQVKGADHLLKAGQLIAETGKEMEDYKEEIGNYLLRIPRIYLKINLANLYLTKINPNFLPKKIRKDFLEKRGKIETLTKFLKTLNDSLPELLNILAFDQSRRYLVVFQNNNEIRPTGGFMGSLALIEVYQGRIEKLEIPLGGFYDLRKVLLNRVNLIPPKPLRLVNYQWQIQDANWFPDFPSSAKKIIWFYSQLDETKKIDGLITINLSLIPELLEITGPIEMFEYERIITANNFISETQKIVGLESPKRESKKFIALLAPKILDRVFKETFDNLSSPPEAENKRLQFLILFFRALREKEILLYFTDEQIQRKVKEFNCTGEIKDVEGDYLMVVNTNIGGGKTDQKIIEKIKHQVQIEEDGSIISQVSITRIHQGQVDDYFIGKRNINYLRIYVPEGSVLLKASGFKIPGPGNFRAPTLAAIPDQDLIEIERNPVIDEASGTRITQEFGKTCFANWVQVDPGETTTVSFKYKLPFKLKGFYNRSKPQIKFYSLFWQKQPGTKTEIKSQLILPKSWRLIWQYPTEEIIQNEKLIEFSSILDKDKLWAVGMR